MPRVGGLLPVSHVFTEHLHASTEMLAHNFLHALAWLLGMTGDILYGGTSHITQVMKAYLKAVILQS